MIFLIVTVNNGIFFVATVYYVRKNYHNDLSGFKASSKTTNCIQTHVGSLS